MKALIDTNLLLDFLTEREPYSEDAVKIITAATDTVYEGYIAAISIPNIFYILRKQYSIKEMSEIITALLDVIKIVGLNEAEIVRALKNEGTIDYEDELQYECAETIGAEYIVTRNTKDFSRKDIKVVTPGEFLGIISNI